MGRRAAPALACILLFGPITFWPLVFDGDSHLVGAMSYLVIAGALAALAAGVIHFGRNARFELTPSTITAYRFGKGVAMPLARIDSLTATRQPSSSSMKVVLNAPVGEGSLTIYPEDRQLRDDALFAWLTSIPQRGGDAIRRPAEPRESPLYERALLGVMGVFVLAVVVLLLTYAIDDARAIFSGYPPLHRLSLTEGDVSRVGPCHPGGKSYSAYLPVTLDTAAGQVRESVACDLAATLNAPPTPHHLAIWRDRRPFTDEGVREVDMDGRALQSYADFIARNRRGAPFSLAGQLLMLAAIALLARGFVAAMREDD